MKYELAAHEAEFRGNGTARHLLVSLSHKDSFAFYRQDLPGDVLFVRDKRHLYYCMYAGMVSDLVEKLVDDNGYERVLFFGLSKGGYGALLLSGLLAKRRPELKSIGLSFSGPTLLYPENPNLSFPSYKGMIRHAKTHERLRQNLEKYGRLDSFLGVPNLLWRMVYGEACRSDAAEASRFIGPNIQKYLLPFSFHGSTIPFTLDRSKLDVVINEVNNIYKDAAKDEDLMATLPKSREELVNQLLAAKWVPNLSTMLEQTLSVAY